jgi:hypothetical protein
MDDQRIKRVLKRYRKGEDLSDSSIDVSSMPIQYLLEACRCMDSRSLDSPKQLDEVALDYLSKGMGVQFEPAAFDYYLHSYVRQEFLSAYYDDPSIVCKPPPENPPDGTRVAGRQWVSVRPKDGEEQWAAYDMDELDGDA